MPRSDPDRAHQAAKPAAQDTTTPPAQHVWLAGLGALAKAQEQGSKAIEALVNDGLAFQRKSQAEAQQRLHEATERLSHMASDFGQPSSGRVDKLEHLFEDRVAKALHRLGMPTLLDMQMLIDRVAQLEALLAAQDKAPLGAKPQVQAKSTAKTAAKTAMRAAPAKSAAKSPTKTAFKSPTRAQTPSAPATRAKRTPRPSR